MIQNGSSNCRQFFLVAINLATISTVCSPALGFSLFSSSGILGSIFIISLSCIIFYTIASALTKTAVLKRVGIMEILISCFGKIGMKICAMIIFLSFLCWFVSQLNLFSKFFPEMLNRNFSLSFFFSESNFLIFFYFLLVCCIFAGDYGLNFIVFVIVPLVMLSIFMTIIFFPIDVKSIMLNLKVSKVNMPTLSFILGNVSAHALSIPVFFKNASSYTESQKTVKIVYLILFPVVLFLGMLFGFSEINIFTSCFPFGGGKLEISIMMYATFSCLAVSFMNIFFASCALSYFFGIKHSLLLRIGVGLLGVFLFWLNINSMEIIVKFLNSVCASILTIIFIKLLLSNLRLQISTKTSQRGSCVALTISCIALFLSAFSYINITGDLFFDAILIAITTFAYAVVLLHKIPDTPLKRIKR